ncbi:hypothetical protein RRG08_060889 [Elysia crispata]|uniref:Uncharacterized protein n=1 Tax=Elysia crispata TaxID=231223 RepID=A0AAE0ZFT4_9GAST|nr:hypothetical protein RRG08_060889 [Elysia crispata]
MLTSDWSTLKALFGQDGISWQNPSLTHRNDFRGLLLLAADADDQVYLTYLVYKTAKTGDEKMSGLSLDNMLCGSYFLNPSQTSHPLLPPDHLPPDFKQLMSVNGPPFLSLGPKFAPLPSHALIKLASPPPSPRELFSGANDLVRAVTPNALCYCSRPKVSDDRPLMLTTLVVQVPIDHCFWSIGQRRSIPDSRFCACYCLGLLVAVSSIGFCIILRDNKATALEHCQTALHSLVHPKTSTTLGYLKVELTLN